MKASLSPHWDRVGISASLACAAHCALMPLLVGVLPALVQAEWLEWALVGLSAGVGLTALGSGYRRHHQVRPLLLLAAGLVCLLGGRIGEAHGGVAFLVLGGLLVAGAHFLNHRLNCGATGAVS